MRRPESIHPRRSPRIHVPYVVIVSIVPKLSPISERYQTITLKTITHFANQRFIVVTHQRSQRIPPVYSPRAKKDSHSNTRRPIAHPVRTNPLGSITEGEKDSHSNTRRPIAAPRARKHIKTDNTLSLPVCSHNESPRCIHRGRKKIRTATQGVR